MSTKHNKRQASLTSLQQTLREAMETWGCPLCRLSRQAEESFVASLSYERILDLKTRAQLQASHGLCATHSRMWLRVKGGSLGVATVYRDVLRRFIATGEGMAYPRRGRRGKHPYFNRLISHMSPEEPCPACEIEAATVRRFGTLLLEGISNPELRAPLESCGGLCIPHLQIVLKDCKSSARARQDLLAIHRAAWQQMLSELNEFVRKNDYRFCHEALTEAEGTAWRRIIDVLVGLDK